eukprot:gene14386-biopygen10884
MLQQIRPVVGRVGPLEPVELAAPVRPVQPIALRQPVQPVQPVQLVGLVRLRLQAFGYISRKELRCPGGDDVGYQPYAKCMHKHEAKFPQFSAGTGQPPAAYSAGHTMVSSTSVGIHLSCNRDWRRSYTSVKECVIPILLQRDPSFPNWESFTHGMLWNPIQPKGGAVAQGWILE